MSNVLRSVKNVTKGYSPAQIKVRKATSNDAWGPTGSEMQEIAHMTYSNDATTFYEIMDMLDKRLNDKGKNWRHVLKSLKVLDYCLHEGSQTCVHWAQKNIYIIKTLREFIYIDETGRDVGNAIRESAKQLTSLIQDEERLTMERKNRNQWKWRVAGLEEMDGPSPRQEGSARRERRNRDDDDPEYRMAIAISKSEAEAEAARRANQSENDADLEKALKLSKEEEEARRRELEEQNNANLLFDDTPAQAPQPTGYNQGYQQQAAVDWFGNPVEQPQPQPTGYLENAYSQPTGMTNMYTGYGYQQPGYGYDQYMQPQSTYNPWAQPQAPQPQPLIEQPTAQPGSNNPWASNTSSTPLAIQPTGSNNPFATHRPTTQHKPLQQQTLFPPIQEQPTARPNPISNFQPAQQPVQSKPQDPYQARLNALLSSGEGQDTFGNVGDLRIPAQHTAPSGFINSAGAGSMGRLEAAKTGSNPFYQKQQQQQQGQQGGSLIDL
ncbi:ENTH-domain-containing protein [Piedraia hortae CBS 480.64]|uniref:ENTH-domain-containing protein n=1 Tax=Piedraia hortae CBS 480.64 TaxID=1314780 RepID=A0A6A7BYN0_9PEZI|nr:ENTH-domain-containing protein [Piedraia hortae CBS 480.64]